MPQVTVYVRDSDLEAWKAIEKKSAWIHEHLNPSDYSGVNTFPKLKKDIKKEETYLNPYKEQREASIEPLWRDKKKGKL